MKTSESIFCNSCEAVLKYTTTTLVLKLCARKSTKITLQITYYVWNMKKKSVKEVKEHIFLVCAYKSQDDA